MGNVHMEASQINYRKGGTKMSVEQALQNAKGGYDYSTDEYSTNSKWIDGSEIFGKIIPLSAGDIGSNGNNTKASGLTNVKILGLKAMIYVKGSDTVDYAFELNIADTYIIQQGGSIRYDYTNNNVIIHTGAGKWGTATGFIELKYIKVTPPETPGE